MKIFAFSLAFRLNRTRRWPIKESENLEPEERINKKARLCRLKRFISNISYDGVWSSSTFKTSNSQRSRLSARVMTSAAPEKSAGDARYASQDPSIQSKLSYTISTPICFRGASFLRRTL